MTDNSWMIVEGNGPIVAAAIHAGGSLQNEVAQLVALGDDERLQEEDPYTDQWVDIAETQITGLKSRFEIDLNRPREKAVYLTPDDAWGLNVWRSAPSEVLIRDSLAIYDGFYREVRQLLDRLIDRHGRVVVYDIHSYNHRRDGSHAEPADPELNPEVNVGTGTMNRHRWVDVVDRFLSDLGDFDYMGRQLDVRENVRFFGGQFPKWIHEQFPDSVCVLSVEFKKFFMDEWTGQPDPEQVEAIRAAMASTVSGVLEELSKL